jgi:hypothetical protein
VRYSAYVLRIYYDSDLRAIYSDLGTIEKYKKRGFKVTSEKDGMILMTGNARLEYKKILLVPETHPMFNEGMFIDTDGVCSSTTKQRIEKTMSKTIKRVFFSKKTQ